MQARRDIKARVELKHQAGVLPAGGSANQSMVVGDGCFLRFVGGAISFQPKSVGLPGSIEDHHQTTSIIDAILRPVAETVALAPITYNIIMMCTGANRRSNTDNQKRGLSTQHGVVVFVCGGIGLSAAVGKWPLVVDRRAWIKRKPLSNQYAVHIPHTWLDEKPPTAHIAYTGWIFEIPIEELSAACRVQRGRWSSALTASGSGGWIEVARARALSASRVWNGVEREASGADDATKQGRKGRESRRPYRRKRQGAMRRRDSTGRSSSAAAIVCPAGRALPTPARCPTSTRGDSSGGIGSRTSGAAAGGRGGASSPMYDSKYFWPRRQNSGRRAEAGSRVSKCQEAEQLLACEGRSESLGPMTNAHRPFETAFIHKIQPTTT
ncbi:hypothetical protein THAOC_29758 [Thalassiosira oceanica]|uniref:Uncharacterized protein n=1 Tax=Thalassiosira oceanica TaxID=159749 RepID=K0RWH6_THAOC|nr:hypothetical protein THAOC_29758 [Thalassiosira oceanica]|eukprot:EJK51102.1 hypothetical protein THAOC_29758 [Thalassiosira oceanica]